MNLLALGLNHRTAPQDLRSRFAFTLDQLAPVLDGLGQRVQPSAAHPEVAMISTCNRTELYCAAGTPNPDFIIDWFSRMGGLTSSALMEHAYLLTGSDAVRHAFRVTSGLDSMVLGDPQISGQVKAAVRQAEGAGTLGSTLHQLFQHAFSVAKDVRTTTEIGRHSLSMGAVAVKTTLEIFGTLENSRVLFIGAGEMIELVSSHFLSRNPKSITIVNRSEAPAADLAKKISAKVMKFEDLSTKLHQFDVVVSCTASPSPLLNFSDVATAMARRPSRPMLMIDLAIPRDVEINVRLVNGIHLYSLDDFSDAVQVASANRHRDIEKANKIVDSGVLKFMRWIDQRRVVPLIKALNSQAENWQKAELYRARKQLAKGESFEAVLIALAQGLTNKILHGVLADLRNGSDEENNQLDSLIKRIFLRCPVENPSNEIANNFHEEKKLDIA